MADSIPNGSVPPATPQGASVAATLDAIPPSHPSEAATLSPPNALEPNTLTHIPDGTAAAACEPVMPTSLPGYEILEEMGRGGMGVVYQGTGMSLEPPRRFENDPVRRFASPDQRVRFLSEAETIAQLRHPYIVQVFDFNQYRAIPISPWSTSRRHTGKEAGRQAAAAVRRSDRREEIGWGGAVRP